MSHPTSRWTVTVGRVEVSQWSLGKVQFKVAADGSSEVHSWTLSSVCWSVAQLTKDWEGEPWNVKCGPLLMDGALVG